MCFKYLPNFVGVLKYKMSFVQCILQNIVWAKSQCMILRQKDFLRKERRTKKCYIMLIKLSFEKCYKITFRDVYDFRPVRFLLVLYRVVDTEHEFSRSKMVANHIQWKFYGRTTIGRTSSRRRVLFDEKGADEFVQLAKLHETCSNVTGAHKNYFVCLPGLSRWFMIFSALKGR